MQMMQGFAASQNAFNAVNPNLNMFGNAMGSMLGSDTMTADHASGILGQANSAMQHMGGTEASRINEVGSARAAEIEQVTDVE
jgi:hypothetical protein